MDFFPAFFENITNTSIPEYIAVITGLLSVWFARKENILVYPVGIISVLIYVYLCFHAGLYADMGINAFYFLMSVFGWYNWARKVGGTHEHVHITSLSLKELLAYISLILLFTFLIYLVLHHYTDSTVPFWDSFTTAVFIIGMLLMALKKLENWIAWIIGDFFCVFLFYYKGLALSSIQYIGFLGLAIAGYYEWYRRYRQNE